MTEQTFRSPGFFEREIDLTQSTVEIEGVPAGIIGTSTLGPAFVPVTLGSFADFETKFGTLNKDQYGPYAVKEWLTNRTAVTFIRVLGAGAVNSGTDITNVQTTGTVKNAGFVIKGTTADAQTPNPVSDKRHAGSVQFIAASHEMSYLEGTGYPLFSDNDSFDTSSSTKLIRAMLFMATGSRMQILDHNQSYSVLNTSNDTAKISSYSDPIRKNDGTFKLVLSSALGTTFGNDESKAGIRIYTASLNPSSEHYIGNFLNKNPEKFGTEQHLLYADFPVQDEIARVTYSAGSDTVGLLSGSSSSSSNSGLSSLSFRDMFGRFDTRYQTARTTSFISQPFGNTEYDLFHFESLDDGEIGNTRVKVSISNLRRSTNVKDPYGTFTVLIRDFNDTDLNPRILEQYPLCTLNPSDENYVANKIGNIKMRYNFDAATESERRFIIEGKYQNKSRYVRIIMHEDVEKKIIPKSTLPFGFRGIPLIKTSESLTDSRTLLRGGFESTRMSHTAGTVESPLTGSILPPIPFRFKTTRGAVKNTTTPSFIGDPGNTELADSTFYWGIKFEKIPLSGSTANTVTRSVLQSNGSTEHNDLLRNYTKFLGIKKLDSLLTGSSSDLFCNNKFTLARVALNNALSLSNTIDTGMASEITGAAEQHIREAAYIRNGTIETKNFTILDSLSNEQRITFATLLAATNEKYFNRFTNYAKFTNMFYGGFDGLNILDSDAKRMNDYASAVESGGKAAGGVIGYENLHSDASPGAGKDNNIVNSYRAAASILTDPMMSRVNIVAVPGIKEPFVTDHVAKLTKEYSKAIYIMDIPSYDDSGNRIYNVDSNTLPSVNETVDAFTTRAIDNNYVATYFPDVILNDDTLNIHISVPSSIAAIKSLGYNDSVAYPWFAPAGFNRGSLSNVVNTKARLNTNDRDVLYDARINPISSFPNGGYVIFGQKTLQQDRSALDRVNVRRMLLEVKRIVSEVAANLLFEQNTQQTRNRFIAEVTPSLSTIQSQQGIDQFRVVMDNTNNTNEDIQNNRLNGKIVLVPTRAIEYIAIDFIITNAGVSFE